jgi:hypothetical protein
VTPDRFSGRALPHRCAVTLCCFHPCLDEGLGHLPHRRTFSDSHGIEGWGIASTALGFVARVRSSLVVGLHRNRSTAQSEEAYARRDQHRQDQQEARPLTEHRSNKQEQ